MKRHGAMMSAIALVSGCEGPPPPSVTPQQRAAFERVSYAAPPPLGFTMSTLRAGDPDGRRIIFVHGTPGSADGWAEFLANVPPGYEHIAVDRPGFGSSDPANAVASLADQAAALAPLLVARDGRWPVLVGHSLGGPIVARLAADRPDRVGALVILAGSLDPALEQLHWAQPMGEWPGIRSVLPRTLRNANRELMALKPQLETLAPALARLRCPVFLLHGTDDQLVPYANVSFMQAHMTDARLTVERIDGQNHFLPWNEVARVRRAILQAAAAGSRHC